MLSEIEELEHLDASEIHASVRKSCLTARVQLLVWRSSNCGGGSLGAAGQCAVFHTTFNVFLSPGANPADSRACRAADSSPIMVNFSALAALPSGRGRLLHLTRVDKACLKTLSASEIKSNQSPAKNFWNLVSNFFLGTYPPRHDMRGEEEEELPPSFLLHFIAMVPPPT